MLVVKAGFFVSNMEPEKVKSNDGKQEVPLNQWVEDERGAKTMYTREKPINFCTDHHQFNVLHECNKCPFIFVGFRANMHIQTEDGIFERKPAHTLGKRLA